MARAAARLWGRLSARSVHVASAQIGRSVRSFKAWLRGAARFLGTPLSSCSPRSSSRSPIRLPPSAPQQACRSCRIH